MLTVQKHPQRSCPDGLWPCLLHLLHSSPQEVTESLIIISINFENKPKQGFVIGTLQCKIISRVHAPFAEVCSKCIKVLVDRVSEESNALK